VVGFPRVTVEGAERRVDDVADRLEHQRFCEELGPEAFELARDRGRKRLE